MTQIKKAPDVSKYGLNLNVVANKSSLGMFDSPIVKPGDIVATPQMASPAISAKLPQVIIHRICYNALLIQLSENKQSKVVLILD